MAIGTDSSGNGNDFATSGLGSQNIVSDSPTNNYGVINPRNPRGKDCTYGDGNLFVYNVGNIGGEPESTFQVPKYGKWCYEFSVWGTSGLMDDASAIVEDTANLGTSILRSSGSPYCKRGKIR